MSMPAEKHVRLPTDSDAILNALPNPVLLVGPDGKIVDANIAAESFFEISTQLLQRQLLKELIPFGSRCWRWWTRCVPRARRSTNTRSISARRGSAATVRSICTWHRYRNGPAIS